MGLGLAVDQLEAIGWLCGAQRHLYWGDLDTYGFAILARASRRFPTTVAPSEIFDGQCDGKTELVRHCHRHKGTGFLAQ